MSAAPVVTSYQPFPKQKEFHACSAKYRLFGGAAGPGKSLALVWEAVRQIMRWEARGKPVNVLLLRRTFPELEESLLLYFRRDVPYERMGAQWNEQKKVATWPKGSRLKFGFCDAESDVYQYQGGEYVFIGIDELTIFTLSMWTYLTSRNRCPHCLNPDCHLPSNECPHKKAFPNMAGTTNPGGIGHKWVRALWGCDGQKQPAQGMERPEEYNPDDYAFIRATLDDNPIYAGDSAYRKTLERLPTRLRDAYLMGRWDIFAGQYFDIFSKARHVGTKNIQPWHPRWLSIDWGFQHPACAHWHSQDGDKTYTYRELWGAQKAERQLAEEICSETGKEKLAAIYLSPDAFAKRTSENTIAEQLDEVFIANGLPRCVPADNDRIGGARLMYGLLANDNWLIDPSCVRLVECLPDLIHDEAKPEDVLKVDAGEGTLGDDPYDAARYGLKSHLSGVGTPFEVVLHTRLLEIPDKTSRAIFAQKWQHDHFRETSPVMQGRSRRAWSQRA